MSWEELEALQRGVELPTALMRQWWPSWHDQAACSTSSANFFPERGESAAPAKAVCRTCPVVADCLDYALGEGSALLGVWGGTTGQERRRLRGQRAA